jgi:hypothetical protein
MQFTLILQNEVDDSIFLLFQSSKFWKRFSGEAAREVGQRLNFYLRMCGSFRAFFFLPNLTPSHKLSIQEFVCLWSFF